MQNAQDLDLWQSTVQFHGHECSGLAIGFRMAKAAERLLGIQQKSEDEEVVCVTENDACGVDAIQYLLGCTFGKGNLIYKPIGKMAMSFYLRDTEKSCRFVLKPFQSKMNREEKQAHILNANFDHLFETKATQELLPKRAKIYQSIVCSACQEETLEAMIHMKEGQPVCKQCDPVSWHTILL